MTTHRKILKILKIQWQEEKGQKDNQRSIKQQIEN
jgi:hypothetical protein